MPRPTFQIAITILWLVTTIWFVKEEILPLTGGEDGGYRTILGDRSGQETTQWTILLNGKEAGRATTSVRFGEHGPCTIVGLLELNDLSSALADRASVPFSERVNYTKVDLRANSAVYVDAHRRLSRLDLSIQLPKADVQVAIRGIVHGQTIFFDVSGLEELPGIPQTFEFPLHEESVYLEKFAPTDRMAELHLDRTWTTRAVNPLASLPGPLKWVLGGKSIELIHNQVIGTEELAYDGRETPCYVIEHRRGREVTRTWAGMIDGRVIRRDFRLAGMKLSLVRNPSKTKEDVWDIQAANGL